MPDLGIKLYVEVSTLGVNDKSRGNLVGLVPYNPSYMLHVGKTIFFLVNNGLPLDSG